MRTIKQLNAAAVAVLKDDGKVAESVQTIVLETMHHAQEHGDVSPVEVLLKGLSGRRQLQKYLFAFFPLRWKKDKDTGTTTLGLTEKRTDADWQHAAAALILWKDYDKAKTVTVKGVKEFRAQLKRVVDGENWTPDAKKLAEKCLELVEEKVAAKPATPEALMAQFAAFMQSQTK